MWSNYGKTFIEYIFLKILNKVITTLKLKIKII